MRGFSSFPVPVLCAGKNRSVAEPESSPPGRQNISIIWESGALSGEVETQNIHHGGTEIEAFKRGVREDDAEKRRIFTTDLNTNIGRRTTWRTHGTQKIDLYVFL